MTETADYDKSAIPTSHASSHESAGADAIDNLGPLTGLIISADGVITWQGASVASIYLFDVRVSGDTYPRFKIRADGLHRWGPGNAAGDTTIYRGSPNSLTTTANFWITGSTIYLTDGIATTLTVTAAILGDTYQRFQFTRDGQLKWGPGSAPTDCLIQRRAANILNTPDRFEVGTLGVANSASGTTPGNCQNKIEVFDAAGNSLGFIAVYDAIT